MKLEDSPFTFTPEMKKYEITAGIVAGLVTIVLLFIAHQIEPQWILNPVLYWGTLVFYILGMMGACLLEKRKGHGILPFRSAVRTAFICFLVANALFFGFYYLMSNVIDPDLALLQKEAAKAYYEQNYSSMELRKYLAQLEEADFSVTFGTVLSGFGYGAIGGFLLSLLVALATRQEA